MVAKEAEIEDLIDRQLRADEEVSEMLKESKEMMKTLEEKNKGLERGLGEEESLRERMQAQIGELQGLVGLYKEKYKGEKLKNRQADRDKIPSLYGE